MLVDFVCREEIHRTKPAGIVEYNPNTLVEIEDHMIVFFDGRDFMDEIADLLPLNEHPP